MCYSLEIAFVKCANVLVLRQDFEAVQNIEIIILNDNRHLTIQSPHWHDTNSRTCIASTKVRGDSLERFPVPLAVLCDIDLKVYVVCDSIHCRRLCGVGTPMLEIASLQHTPLPKCPCREFLNKLPIAWWRISVYKARLQWPSRSRRFSSKKCLVTFELYWVPWYRDQRLSL